jgi:NhaA family Na+:H+ antiporter
VGFTMSLFIGGLSFDPDDMTLQTEVRVGVVAGSLLSTLVGMAVLALAQRKRTSDEA